MARLLRCVCAGLLVGACGESPADPPRRAAQGAVPDEVSTYVVSGLVSDARGVPVSAARVEVLAPGFEGVFVVADRDGRYRIANLMGGVRLQVTKDGYRGETRGVGGRGDATVDFTLEAETTR